MPFPPSFCLGLNLVESRLPFHFFFHFFHFFLRSALLPPPRPSDISATLPVKIGQSLRCCGQTSTSSRTASGVTRGGRASTPLSLRILPHRSESLLLLLCIFFYVIFYFFFYVFFYVFFYLFSPSTSLSSILLLTPSSTSTSPLLLLLLLLLMLMSY